MKVFVATKNVGKLRELIEIFSALADWTLVPYAGYADVTEGETSYAENARRKATALASQLRAIGVRDAVLGDDSGLEVTALGNRPGVLSARYGGEHATWSARRARLLAELGDLQSADRTAAFVCALHFIDEFGSEYRAERRIFGTIATRERGDGGFSYDSLFDYRGRTFAEYSEAEKNACSHRALAAAAIVEAARHGAQKGVEAGM